MPSANWREQIFRGEAARRPEARIREQVDGLESLLSLKFRARVLDLGCGAGAQTLELARRRYRVVGMDSSARALGDARESAKAESLTVHFLAQDMRVIPYEAEFDAVVNTRNPLGRYPSERDDLKCLKAVQKALKPWGRLLLDLLNREWVVRRMDEEEAAKAFDLRTGRIDWGSFRARGGSHQPNEALRLYSLTEIVRMLEDAGLTFRRVFGGYDGRPYGLDSPRMLVAAEKDVAAAERRRKREQDDLPRALRIKGRPR